MENVSESMKKWMDQNNQTAHYIELMSDVYRNGDVVQFINDHRDELDEDHIDRSAAKLYEYVTEKRKLANGETTFAPGYEPHLIMSNHLIDVAYAPTKETVAREKMKSEQRRLKTISMPKLVKDASLTEFEKDENRVLALKEALQFISAFEASPRTYHQGLYLYGSFGVGKTYLLGAIANQLAHDGYSTTMVHFPSFAVEMKNAIATNNVADKLEAVRRAPILMLDDIGADSVSDWIRDEVLAVILEYRMQEELPTFFSSNLSMAKLESEYLTVSKKSEAPLKAKRIMQRVRFLAKQVEMVGQNRRPN